MDPLENIYRANDIIDEQRSIEMVTFAIFFAAAALVMTLMIMALILTILMIITVAILTSGVGENNFYHHDQHQPKGECVYITTWTLKNMSIDYPVLLNSHHHVVDNMHTVHQGPIQCVYTTTGISRVQGNFLRGYPPHIRRHSHVYDRIH